MAGIKHEATDGRYFPPSSGNHPEQYRDPGPPTADDLADGDVWEGMAPTFPVAGVERLAADPSPFLVPPLPPFTIVQIDPGKVLVDVGQVRAMDAGMDVASPGGDRHVHAVWLLGSRLIGETQERPGGAREPLQVHPGVTEALRNLLFNPEFRGVGYSEFILRAVCAAWEEVLLSRGESAGAIQEHLVRLHEKVERRTRA